MMSFRAVRVGRHQRGVWFRDGDVQGVLTPGRHRFWRANTAVEVHDIADGEYHSEQLRSVMGADGAVEQELGEYLDITQLDGNQVGMLLVDKRVARLIPPGGVCARWREAENCQLDVVDFSANAEVPVHWLQALEQTPNSIALFRGVRDALLRVKVEYGHVALLMVNGQCERVLTPGQYGFFRFDREVYANQVDLRLQELEVNGQEILTRDRVSLRVNAVAQYRVEDPVKAAADVADVQALIYRALQFALRQTLGALPLDELLADKSALTALVHEAVATQVAMHGVVVDAVGVKDIILPGEMKTILNQVVEAEKQAEANSVRRREETANVRQLANTARQLEGNAMMARLRELETLERVTQQIDSMTVFNGLGGVLQELVQLVPKEMSASSSAEKIGEEKVEEKQPGAP